MVKGIQKLADIFAFLLRNCELIDSRVGDEEFCLKVFACKWHTDQNLRESFTYASDVAISLCNIFGMPSYQFQRDAKP